MDNNLVGLELMERNNGPTAVATYSAANVNVGGNPTTDQSKESLTIINQLSQHPQDTTTTTTMIAMDIIDFKEDDDDVDSSNKNERVITTTTTPLVFAMIVAAASQFLVGYNIGVMNAPEKVIFPGHSTAIWSLAVAAFAVGGPLGALVGGRLADSHGRRGALLIDTWTFLFGGVLQTLAPNMYIIMISRFIIGFASGYSSVLVPIYLGELAPPTLRGRLGTVTQFALVIGILIADLMAFPFATTSSWRFLFSVTAIVAFVQLLCSPFLLESPRWLLNRDPHCLLARYNVKRLRGLRYDHEVEIEVNTYALSGGTRPAEKQEPSSNGRHGSILMEILYHSQLRALLISSLILQMAQQLCGINAVFYYSTSFFDGVIESPLAGTTLVGGVNVLATHMALLLMDQYGRRDLMLWSSGGMFCSCIVIVMALLGYFNNIMALVAVNVYVLFFEIGLGPIPWLIVAEMFDGKYVAVAMSLCSQLNWICNFIIGLIFPYMNQYLGPYSFVPFAVVLGITFIFSWTILPETQGTTPEELMVEMTMTRRRHSNNKTDTVVVVAASSVSDDADDIDPIKETKWRKVNIHLTERKSGASGYGFQPIHQHGDSII